MGYKSLWAVGRAGLDLPPFPSKRMVAAAWPVWRTVTAADRVRIHHRLHCSRGAQPVTCRNNKESA
jgi:hypothetical protein